MPVPDTYCALCHHRCDPDRLYADRLYSRRQEKNLSPCCGARLISRRSALTHYLALRLHRHFIHNQDKTFTIRVLANLRAERG
jgi:hypothetical protein